MWVIGDGGGGGGGDGGDGGGGGGMPVGVVCKYFIVCCKERAGRMV